MSLTNEQLQELRKWLALFAGPDSTYYDWCLALLDENKRLKGQVGRLRILAIDAQSDLRRAANTLEIITSSHQALADSGETPE